MAARVDASVSGGFDWLKQPGQLETYVRTRLASYGQVLLVHVTPTGTLPGGLFSSRYVATVSFIPTNELSTDRLRDIVAGAFRDWNGVPAAVTITSRGEAPQLVAASPFDGVSTLLMLGAVIVVALAVRDVAR